jgi:hypothetical protein
VRDKVVDTVKLAIAIDELPIDHNIATKGDLNCLASGWRRSRHERRRAVRAGSVDKLKVIAPAVGTALDFENKRKFLKLPVRKTTRINRDRHVDGAVANR